jgi:hypothetical protein
LLRWFVARQRATRNKYENDQPKQWLTS